MRKRKKKQRKKKIIHVVPMTPYQAGMYETVREITYFERKMGYNAFIFDARPSEKELKQNIGKQSDKVIHCPQCNAQFSSGEKCMVNAPAAPPWTEDRGICNVPFDFVKDADLIVSHAGMSPKLLELKKDYIHVAHGRPYSSFLIEHSEQSAIYSSYEFTGRQKNLIAAITLWPEYVDYLSLLFPKLYAFDAFVDLDKWKPVESDYNFSGQKAEINVVCADIWRLDKDPYHILNAFRLFHKKYPQAKLHIYAAKQDLGWNCLIGKMRELGMIGEIQGMVPHLHQIYTAADVLITPHKIATRTIRESLASGLQVVAGLSNRFTPYTADVEDLPAFADQIEKAWLEKSEESRKRNRHVAEDKFNPEVNIKQFCDLYESILK